MSVLAVAAFEIGRRRRMLSSYVYGGVLFACGLLSMLAAGGAFSSISVGGGSDAVHANAPELLQGMTAMLSHLSMMITAVVIAIDTRLTARVPELARDPGRSRAASSPVG